MLKQWRDKRLVEQRASGLYAAVAELARAPRLFTEMQIADTVDGRLEMLVLHLVLIMDRLRRVGREGDVVARALGEVFVSHMDDTMRSIGVGDLSVPRKVKRTAAALYEAHQEYGAALTTEIDAGAAWRHALYLRLISRAAAPSADVEALAVYVMAWQDRVRTQPDAAIMEARIG